MKEGNLSMFAVLVLARGIGLLRVEEFIESAHGEGRCRSEVEQEYRMRAG